MKMLHTRVKAGKCNNNLHTYRSMKLTKKKTVKEIEEDENGAKREHE